MKDKCEWKNVNNLKDGGYKKVFYPCKRFDGRFLERDLPDDKDNPNYCLYCKVDIRKPEPEVIIKRSGGTWGVRNEGIDYLFVSKSNLTIENIKTHFELYLRGMNWCFKPISEIEITDEIALLRPMVITSVLPKNVLSKLIAKENSAFSGDREISGGFFICSYRDNVFTTMGVELATVADLED